jgi:hypothetical protein
MATTRSAADAFIAQMQKTQRETMERLSIERDDVVVSISVSVNDTVRYSSREDED